MKFPVGWCFVSFFFKFFFFHSTIIFNFIKNELSHHSGSCCFFDHASAKYLRKFSPCFQTQRWQNFCQAANWKGIRYFFSKPFYLSSHSLGAGRAALPHISYMGKGGVRKLNDPPKLIIEAWHRARAINPALVLSHYTFTLFSPIHVRSGRNFLLFFHTLSNQCLKHFLCLWSLGADLKIWITYPRNSRLKPSICRLFDLNFLTFPKWEAELTFFLLSAFLAVLISKNAKWHLVSAH